MNIVRENTTSRNLLIGLVIVVLLVAVIVTIYFLTRPVTKYYSINNQRMVVVEDPDYEILLRQVDKNGDFTQNGAGIFLSAKYTGFKNTNANFVMYAQNFVDKFYRKTFTIPPGPYGKEHLLYYSGNPQDVVTQTKIEWLQNGPYWKVFDADGVTITYKLTLIE